MNDGDSTRGAPKKELKYASVYRVADKRVLLQTASTSIKKVFAEELSEELKDVVGTFTISNVFEDMRESFDSMHGGQWLSTCDHSKIVYSVYADEDVSSSAGYSFLKELKRELFAAEPAL